VQFGTVAGPAHVVVTAPVLGLRDTASYTVRPGAPAAVRFGVRDATAYVGGTRALAPVVRDRFGNARPDAVTVASADASVAAVDAAGIVSGRDIGRTRLVARAVSGSAAPDTAFVTVVPPGRLAGWVPDFPGDAGGQLVTVNMDGSQLQRVVPASGVLGVFPRWSRDGARIAYHGGAPVALVVDTAGTQVRTVDASRAEGSGFPDFTPDGALLYLSIGDGPYRVWRADAPGSTPRLVTTLDGPLGYGAYGAIDYAPDGTRLVYANYWDGLTVVDLVTGASRALGTFGSSPRWSPDGRTIAYLTEVGGVAVMNADGTGRRVLNAILLSPGLAWSPDGRYVLGRTSDFGGGMRLTRVSDGLVLPFTMPVDLFQPSWR